jgi:hypothetical protein
MMVCEIGIAPVKPAEFVIFHIRQITPGATELGAPRRGRQVNTVRKDRKENRDATNHV